MICKICNIDKSESNFSIAYVRNGNPYIRKSCKACNNEKQAIRSKSTDYHYKYVKGKKSLSDRYIRDILDVRGQIPYGLIELQRQLLILKKTIYEYIQRGNTDSNRFQPETIGRRNGYKNRKPNRNKYPSDYQCCESSD